MPKTTGVKMVVNPAEKESVCREVLGDFPEKLERENGIEDIVAQCRLMPVWADLDGDAVPRYVKQAPARQRCSSSPCGRNSSGTR